MGKGIIIGSSTSGGNSISSEREVPAGGTTGQILAKTSETDYDTQWINPPEGNVIAGDDGATFTPSVSEDGVLSWTNDKELENPEPVNIKGPKGDNAITLIQSANVYTGEEQCIGRWTDGKPLYRKIYTGTTNASLGNTIVANVADLSIDYHNLSGSVVGTDGVRYSLPYASGDIVCNPIINNTPSLIIVTAGLDALKSASFTVTIEYTKTTDTAESSLIVYPHAYSTEETVIGTWIDGKPLYRKVYLCKTPSSNTAADVADITDLNYETLTNLYSIIGNYMASNISTCYSASGFHAITSLSSSADGRLHIRMNVYNAFYNMDATVIIEYTKTTDEATVAIASADELNAAYDEGVQSA